MAEELDRLNVVASRNRGVLTRGAAIADGLTDAILRRHVLRGSLVRIARGVYTVGQRELEDPGLIARRHKVVISRESAAAVLGIDLPHPITSTEVTAPRNRGQRRAAYPGVRLHRSNLAGHEITEIRGVPVTTHLRTALDIARTSKLDDAVCIVDGFLRKGSFTVEEFLRAVNRSAGPGRARMQLVSTLIDQESGSILESMTRVLLWRRGLMPPQSQFDLRHRPSGWRGRVDFAWPDLKLVLECDGYEWHADRSAFQRDRRRWSTINRMGWRLAVVTWFDVTGEPEYVVALLRDLIAEARLPSLQQHTFVADETHGVAV